MVQNTRKHANFHNLPARIAGLGELAENLWWSWNPAARSLFKQLNRQVWKESIHNPDKMLKELPQQLLDAAAEDPDYLRHYDLLLSHFHKYMAPRTCSLLPSGCMRQDTMIAYYSAEYGLHHSLPFYAGGLGFLAGDYIKECSDLQLPMVAVGFMYPEGYVKQRVGDDGWQQSLHQVLDREAASISRVYDDQGNHLAVRVPLIEPPIYVTVWQVMIGRIPLYLMDTDTDLNKPWNRTILAQLYSGDLEQRLRQEILLGIGGAEMLETLGITPVVAHLNEGHAAFTLLERIRDLLQTGLSFAEASEQVRSTTIFTTHTPVPAGHDVFPFQLIEKYFKEYWTSMGLDYRSFMELGIHPEKPNEGFNMTAFAMRLSGNLNGVSKKHGEVTRRMWQVLWPDLPESEVPIKSITNGIHVPTWIEPKMELLFNRYLGPDWLNDHDNQLVWELVDEIPDRELWDTHVWLKIKLFDVIKERARHRWAVNHVNPSVIMTGGTLLDPSVLTIGFARRLATYKRATLLLHDIERLKKLLNDRWQPIQIIFAGKAHPADDPGKMMLQEIFNAARDPALGGRIAFVEDYGEQFAQYLVHGVDVWLNNPLPPMEACGTSGMKASLNGVPNLSINDGWWLEGYNGDNGWAFDHAEENGDQDGADAEALYHLLEKHVIPLYYQMSEHNLPLGWIQLMKNAIKSSGARFSARRMVKEYINTLYAGALQTAASAGHGRKKR